MGHATASCYPDNSKTLIVVRSHDTKTIITVITLITFNGLKWTYNDEARHTDDPKNPYSGQNDTNRNNPNDT